MTPVLMEKRRDEVDEMERAWSAPGNGDQAVALVEDPPSRPRPLALLSSMRSVPTTSEDHSENGATQTISFTIDASSEGETNTHRLRSSFTAISRLRSQRSAGDWVAAAATLKHDAVRFRGTHLARHSAVLLALADALTFTEPSDPMLDAQAGAVFDHGLSLLSESFVSEPAEEAFLVDLMSHGWHLVPSAGIEPLEE